MRRPPATPWLLVPVLVTGLALMTGIAVASEPLILKSAEPEDLSELRARAEQVEGAYDAAVCGGILPDENVGEEVGEGISAVTGVPGRSGRPLANIRSGLGVKDAEGGQFNDGFLFPETAQGLSTRCLPEVTALRKLVFAYDRLSYIRFPTIGAPFFTDPPCLTTPGDCEQFCSELNAFTYPDCAVLKGDEKRGIGCALWCQKSTCTDGWTNVCSTSLSDLTGGAIADSPPVPELSLYNDRLVFDPGTGYVDYETLAPVFNEYGFPITFGETQEYNEPIDLTPPEANYPNCVPCTGEQCRCSLQVPPEPEKNPICLLVVPDADVGKPSLVNVGNLAEILSACRLAGLRTITSNSSNFDSDGVVSFADCLANLDGGTEGLSGGVYASFFRQYAAFATRRAYPQVAPDDQNEKEARVACYGFYDEFDPLDRETVMTIDDPAVGEEEEGGGAEPRVPKDARCVIDLDTTNFPDTQKGTGETPASPAAETYTPFAREPGSTSPWFRDLAGAFSLMHSDDDPDLDTLATSVLTLRDTDTAALQALPTLHRASLAPFDETGPQQVVSGWWSHLSAVFAEATSPPIVTLLLPKIPSAIPSLDEPLFQNTIPEHVPSTDPTAPFEVQLGVGEDLPGQVAAFMERDLLFRVEEKPMPVLIPGGTADDLRALAQDWCTYAVVEKKKRDCKSDEDIMVFVDKLETYAKRLEEVATLRAELAKTLKELLAAREDSLKAIADWKKNAEEALAPALDDLDRIKNLRQRWEDLSLNFAKIGAVTNFPWCMNQRFTLPILWLLDPWLPSREKDGKISMEKLPLPKIEKRPADLELDFSLLDLRQGAISVPVLKTSQVTLDLVRLSPPGVGGKPPTMPEFKSLEPVKQALESARQALAEVTVKSEPPLPQVPDVLSDEREQELLEAADKVDSVITGINEAYERFWKPRKPEFQAENEALSCEFWGEGVCLYSEMELVETIMRIMSRVGVFFQQDLLPLSPLGRFTPTTCLFNDGGCLPEPPVSRPPAEGWQVVAPSADDSETLDGSRRDIREATLPKEIDEEGASSLKSIPWSYNGPDLLPGLEIHTSIDLIPASSSSTSSDA